VPDKYSLLFISLGLLVFISLGCSQVANNNSGTTSGSGSYYTGTYPSVADLAGSNYTQAQLNTSCEAAWNHFKTQLITNEGAVMRTDNNDVVSEGQSYGMMLAVENNDQETFDKIWNWTKTYMQPSQPQGLFCWNTELDGTVKSPDSASDAEEMIALALFFASNRWGEGAAPYNYSVQAKDILTKMLSHEVTSDNYFAMAPSSLDGFNASYFMPAFFRLFAIYTGETRWNSVASNSYVLINACLQAQYGNTTNGLIADFFQEDGTPGYESLSQYFSYDAMRTPWHIALDEVWFGDEAAAQAYLDKIIGNFFGPIYSSFGSIYNLDGTIKDQTADSNYHETSYIGSFAGGAMGASSSANKVNFLNHLMAQEFPTGQYRYYDICWQNFGLLFASGNFKIY